MRAFNVNMHCQIKLFILLIATLILPACSNFQNSQHHSCDLIERKFYNSWEKDIGYAQVIKVGNKLLISGITSEGDNIEAQVKGIYANLETILADYSVGTDRIIKETIFVKDIDAFKSVISLRRSYYPENQYPTSSWLQIERLFLEQFLVEIEFEVAL